MHSACVGNVSCGLVGVGRGVGGRTQRTRRGGTGFIPRRQGGRRPGLAPGSGQLRLPVFQLGFYKGPAGSQVTLSSLGNQTRVLLEEQARHLLNEQERATMAYYLEEYRGGSVSVEALVMALFELLNTHAKVAAPLPGLCVLPCLPGSPLPPLPRTHREAGPTDPRAGTGDRGGPLPGKPRLLRRQSMKASRGRGPD